MSSIVYDRIGNYQVDGFLNVGGTISGSTGSFLHVATANYGAATALSGSLNVGEIAFVTGSGVSGGPYLILRIKSGSVSAVYTGSIFTWAGGYST